MINFVITTSTTISTVFYNNKKPKLIAVQSEFHRCNLENHKLGNENFSKNRPEIQGKIRISQLTFIPVKTVHKMTHQNTVELNFIDSANSRPAPIFSSESSTNVLILLL